VAMTPLVVQPKEEVMTNPDALSTIILDMETDLNKANASALIRAG